MPKNTFIVVSKENNISRQTVKLIYVKDQANDSQTQRTGQAIVSSTAVQAELQMVNDPVEDNSTSKVSAFNTSSLARTNTCYNKFLLLHNLPTINYFITLEEFLFYLRKHSFKNNFKISVNQNNTELHIYTNLLDPILHEHHLIHPSQFETYKHLPLLTTPLDYLFFTDPPFTSSSTNLSSISESDFTASRLETSFQFTSPSLYPDDHTAETSISETYKPLHLSICTHNTRGYNDNLKQQVWEDYCLSHNINIASITETKISQSNANAKFPRSQQFTYYWSCTDSCKVGTAIMIQKHLKPHVHKILQFPGYAIAIDLFFKHDFKFRIISIYLPCDDLQLRLLIQNNIIQ